MNDENAFSDAFSEKNLFHIIYQQTRAYFSMAFPTFCGLGNPKCGLENLKVWKGFFLSGNIFVIKMFGPLGIVLPKCIDRPKEIFRSQWLLFPRM